MSDTALPAPDRIRLAPVALWRVAETFLRFMIVLFGAPEDVAASHTLSRKLALQLREHLAAGEALLRRLLLIEDWGDLLPAPSPGLAASNIE